MKSKHRLTGQVLLAVSAVALLLFLVVSVPTPRQVTQEHPVALAQPSVRDEAGLRVLQARYRTLQTVITAYAT